MRIIGLMLFLSVANPFFAVTLYGDFSRMNEKLVTTQEQGLSLSYPFRHHDKRYDVVVSPSYVPSSWWDTFWGAETVYPSHSLWLAPGGIVSYEGKDFCFVVREKRGGGGVVRHSSCGYDFVMTRKAIEWCSREESLPSAEVLKEVASFSDESWQKAALYVSFRCYLMLVASAYKEEKLPEGFEAPIFFDWK